MTHCWASVFLREDLFLVHLYSQGAALQGSSSNPRLFTRALLPWQALNASVCCPSSINLPRTLISPSASASASKSANVSKGKLFEISDSTLGASLLFWDLGPSNPGCLSSFLKPSKGFFFLVWVFHSSSAGRLVQDKLDSHRQKQDTLSCP